MRSWVRGMLRLRWRLTHQLALLRTWFQHHERRATVLLVQNKMKTSRAIVITEKYYHKPGYCHYGEILFAHWVYRWNQTTTHNLGCSWRCCNCQWRKRLWIILNKIGLKDNIKYSKGMQENTYSWSMKDPLISPLQGLFFFRVAVDGRRDDDVDLSKLPALGLGLNSQIPSSIAV